MRNTAAKTKREMIPGRDPASQLYRAVRRYVESNGGAIVVIGGIYRYISSVPFVTALSLNPLMLVLTLTGGKQNAGHAGSAGRENG